MTSAAAEKTGMQKFLDTIQPFWIGGLSGMTATCVVQPIDMIKVVIQLKSEAFGKAHTMENKLNFFTAAKDIYSREGIKGFYRGYRLNDADSTLP